jgi:hypothetical protein
MGKQAEQLLKKQPFSYLYPAENGGINRFCNWEQFFLNWELFFFVGLLFHVKYFPFLSSF